jgi:TRAP-type C4-dicarboxylate transport system permease small subunit
MRWSFMKLASRTEAGIHSADKVAAVVASVALVAMMLLTVADVVGRYCFNRPIRGVWEIVGLTMVLAGTWGWGYCQMQKGHVRVDIILGRFPRKIQTIIQIVAYLIGFVVFSLMSWRAFLLAADYLTRGRAGVTDILEIPYYPIWLALVIGAGLLALTALIDLLRSLSEVKRK